MPWIKYMHFDMPNKRRQDKRVENYWIEREKKWPLNSYEQHQKEWNFIESEYSPWTLMHNGLDQANPGFAYKTKYVKYIKYKEYNTETSETRDVST